MLKKLRTGAARFRAHAVRPPKELACCVAHRCANITLHRERSPGSDHTRMSKPSATAQTITTSSQRVQRSRPGMDRWGWKHLEPWRQLRTNLPAGARRSACYAAPPVAAPAHPGGSARNFAGQLWSNRCRRQAPAKLAVDPGDRRARTPPAHRQMPASPFRHRGRQGRRRATAMTGLVAGCRSCGWAGTTGQARPIRLGVLAAIRQP